MSGQLLHQYHRPVGISLKNGSFQGSVRYILIMVFTINYILFYPNRMIMHKKILHIQIF